MGHKPIEITTGCKRDNKPKTKRMRRNKPKANKPKKSSDNVHPLFNEAANLNYIDDEDSCCENSASKPVNVFIKQIEDENEEEEEEEEEDEGNVIYEGDSNDENDENKEFLNVLDEDDDDKTLDEEDEMNLEDFIENEDELKCRSAPITPARLSPMLLSSNSSSGKDNCRLG